MESKSNDSTPPASLAGGEVILNELDVKNGTESAVAVLKSMHGDRRIHVVSIGFDEKLKAKTFEPEDLEPLRAWLTARQSNSNLYFHVNELDANKSDKKAVKADIIAAHYLHVDVDNTGALELFLLFKPKPTILVASGGGFQAFWRLKEASQDLAAVERCNKQLSMRLDGDNCHNIDRIMRVPGTVNILNPKKIAKGRKPALSKVLYEHTDLSRCYCLSDFDELGADAPGSAVAIDIATVQPTSLEGISVPLNEYTKALIVDGDDVNRPIGSVGARYPSRSEVVFRITCDLLRAEVPEQQVVGVLINPKYGNSESVLKNLSLPNTPSGRSLQLRRQLETLGLIALGADDQLQPTETQNLLSCDWVFMQSTTHFITGRSLVGMYFSPMQENLPTTAARLFVASFSVSSDLIRVRRTLMRPQTLCALKTPITPSVTIYLATNGMEHPVLKLG